MGNIQAIAQKYRRAIIAKDVATARHLQQQYHHLYPEIQRQIDVLIAKMSAGIGEDGKVPPSWLYEQQRLTTLLHTIKTQEDHYASIARGIVHTQQTWATQQGVEAAQAMLHATVPAGVTYGFGVVPPHVIENQMSAVDSESPLGKLFATFGADAATKAKQTLVLHTALGSDPAVIARALRDDMQIPLSRATVIARTESLRNWRSAATANYAKNSDVVSGWVWLATTGACAACMAMQGTTHDVSEDLESHQNCRCCPVPKTRSYADILGNLGIDGSGIEEVPLDIPNGEDFLASQDAAIQRQSFSSDAAYQLWKSGDASLNDFTGTSNDDDWGRSVYQRSLTQVKQHIERR